MRSDNRYRVYVLPISVIVEPEDNGRYPKGEELRQYLIDNATDWLLLTSEEALSGLRVNVIRMTSGTPTPVETSTYIETL